VSGRLADPYRRPGVADLFRAGPGLGRRAGLQEVGAPPYDLPNRREGALKSFSEAAYQRVGGSRCNGGRIRSCHPRPQGLGRGGQRAGPRASKHGDQRGRATPSGGSSIAPGQDRHPAGPCTFGSTMGNPSRRVGSNRTRLAAPDAGVGGFGARSSGRDRFTTGHQHSPVALQCGIAQHALRVSG